MLTPKFTKYTYKPTTITVDKNNLVQTLLLGIGNDGIKSIIDEAVIDLGDDASVAAAAVVLN